eukprot:g4157.t1
MVRFALYLTFAVGSSVLVLKASPGATFSEDPFKGMLYGFVLALTALAMFHVGHHDITRRNSRVLLVLGGLIGHLLVVRLVMILADAGTIREMYRFLFVPFALAPMLHGILLGRTVGGFSAVYVSLIGSLLVPREDVMNYLIVSLVAGMTAVLCTERLRKRTQLLRAGIYVGLVMIVLALVLGKMGAMSVFGEEMVIRLQILGMGSAIAFLTSLGTAMLISGFLPMFEHSFHLTTDISWLELSDLNHRLLKKMQLEAPGTFHHSLVVAALSEAAAESIGANAPMCRVCSYFHDVGKLKKPGYFIENQGDGGENPHDSLTPTMSALIITAHVKDGVDMAVKNKLNPRIIEVIQEHHGDSLVYFFYRKAQEQKKAEMEKVDRRLENPEDLPKVEEKNFRYPGPRPSTKESGIICLADTIERNHQTVVEIPTSWLTALEAVAEKATAMALAVAANAENSLCHLAVLEVAIVDDETSSRVHVDFMDIKGATDVITFHHGEIVIGAEVALRQAAEYSEPLGRELLRYFVHGLLHLAGHEDACDDERAVMERAQEEIVARLWEDELSAKLETPTIVTYKATTTPAEKPQEQKTKSKVQKKPTAPASSQVKVIATDSPSAVSIPVPDVAIETEALDFGDGADFGGGWGEDISMDSGGGATFFQTEVKAERVAYVIDYSLSMKQLGRNDLMRKELAKSVGGMGPGTKYQLIFFAGPAWLASDELKLDASKKNIEEIVDVSGKSIKVDKSKKYAKRDIPWRDATSENIKASLEKIEKTPLILGTYWATPLEMAMEMDPKPQVIFFMTDGLTGGDMKKMVRDLSAKAKRSGIAINTVSLIEPKADEFMAGLAFPTGGQFTLVEKGGKVRVMSDENQEGMVEVLEKIALLLELKGENPFKVRAYRQGAEVVSSIEDDVVDRARNDDLKGVKGIGEALREKLGELAKTGKLEFYEKLKGEFPATIFEIFEVQGLGPKKIKTMYDSLGIDSLPKLKAACEEGRISALPGFGKKTEVKILEGIAANERFADRFTLGSIGPIVDEILELLRLHPEIAQVAVAGSYRRAKETVGDLDFLVSTKEGALVCEDFTTIPHVDAVIACGDTKASVRLKNGIYCDLRAVRNEEFPFALQYFTGSKEHNVALRSLALKKGWSLNEYGLNPVSEEVERPEVNEEKDIYRALGLQFVEPELRENRGEIEAAMEKELPRLVELMNLRGTFHNHTTASDGRDTLEGMVEEAMELGFQYLGISDHSKSSVYAHGLDEDRLMKQVEQIRELEKGLGGFRIFAGSEVDILMDGSLDFGDDILKGLDYVVASVHNFGNLDEAAMTERICRAMENEHVTMLGHLTGRLLLKRDGYAVDHAKIIDCAAATRTVIELNCSPLRLDMDWRWWKRARDKNVLCSINPDAHSRERIHHAAFESAEAVWESIITGYQIDDIDSTSVNIEVNLGNIDGVGGTLGSAGPTEAKRKSSSSAYTSTFLYTSTGSMTFDTSDTDTLESSGSFGDVILHEMGHVLGIGTLWSSSAVGVAGRQELYVDGSGEYTGAYGLSAYNTEFGQSGSFVPVELGGGAGTANGHWNEVDDGAADTGIVSAYTGDDLKNELMTGRAAI